METNLTYQQAADRLGATPEDVETLAINGFDLGDEHLTDDEKLTPAGFEIIRDQLQATGTPPQPAAWVLYVWVDDEPNSRWEIIDRDSVHDPIDPGDALENLMDRWEHAGEYRLAVVDRDGLVIAAAEGELVLRDGYRDFIRHAAGGEITSLNATIRPIRPGHHVWTGS